MFVVPMPENIKKYKGSLYFGLSVRRFVTLMPLCIYGVLAFLFIKPYIGEDLTIFTILLLSVILVPIGLFEPYGMPFEKYISLIWKYKIQRPGIRRIAYRNLLAEAIEEEYTLLEKQLYEKKQNSKTNDSGRGTENSSYKRRRRMKRW